MDFDRIIRPSDVADSVEFVLNSSEYVCPTEIFLRIQKVFGNKELAQLKKKQPELFAKL